MESSSGAATTFLTLTDNVDPSTNNWSKREKYVWFFTLLSGTSALYACRTTMPLVSPGVAADMHWSKTEVGTILASFFYGYTLTQIVGGYLSDRFSPERVLLAAGAGWGLITFWFHRIIVAGSSHHMTINFVVAFRVLLGAFQGVHFPAMASISSRNLCARDRSFFFSATTAGGAVGTLVTGTLGSLINETLGWTVVFYAIGFLSLLWVAALKYYAMEMSRQKQSIVGMGSSFSLLGSASSDTNVPWITYLKSSALWACIFCHFCQNNCFFILLSWLPTYFHDNFPGAKSWVFNVVPWLLMVPGLGLATVLTSKLLASGHSVTTTRKTVQAICMGTEAITLILIGTVSSYELALLLTTCCLFAAAFHNAAVVVNPQDLAPKHSGCVFGMMNAIGAVPGFIGVYLAGYILELTGSWSAVFNVTAVINVFGLIVFLIFGSGNPII